MKIYLKRTINGFTPLYDSDLDQARKIKIGDEVEAEIKRPRNYMFHKKFFALLNLGFQNQDHYDNFEHFRFVMTMKAGHYEIVKSQKGEQLFFPKSISFGKMTEDEFEKLYNSMIDVIIGVIGADKETIENELINFL